MLIGKSSLSIATPQACCSMESRRGRSESLAITYIITTVSIASKSLKHTYHTLMAGR